MGVSPHTDAQEATTTSLRPEADPFVLDYHTEHYQVSSDALDEMLSLTIAVANLA